MHTTHTHTHIHSLMNTIMQFKFKIYRRESVRVALLRDDNHHVVDDRRMDDERRG